MAHPQFDEMWRKIRLLPSRLQRLDLLYFNQRSACPIEVILRKAEQQMGNIFKSRPTVKPLIRLRVRKCVDYADSSTALASLKLPSQPTSGPLRANTSHQYSTNTLPISTVSSNSTSRSVVANSSATLRHSVISLLGDRGSSHSRKKPSESSISTCSNVDGRLQASFQASTVTLQDINTSCSTPAASFPSNTANNKGDELEMNQNDAHLKFNPSLATSSTSDTPFIDLTGSSCASATPQTSNKSTPFRSEPKQKSNRFLEKNKVKHCNVLLFDFKKVCPNLDIMSNNCNLNVDENETTSKSKGRKKKSHQKSTFSDIKKIRTRSKTYANKKHQLVHTDDGPLKKKVEIEEPKTSFVRGSLRRSLSDRSFCKVQNSDEPLKKKMTMIPTESKIISTEITRLSKVAIVSSQSFMPVQTEYDSKIEANLSKSNSGNTPQQDDSRLFITALSRMSCHPVKTVNPTVVSLPTDVIAAASFDLSSLSFQSRQVIRRIEDKLLLDCEGWVNHYKSRKCPMTKY